MQFVCVFMLCIVYTSTYYIYIYIYVNCMCAVYKLIYIYIYIYIWCLCILCLKWYVYACPVYYFVIRLIFAFRCYLLCVFVLDLPDVGLCLVCFGCCCLTFGFCFHGFSILNLPGVGLFHVSCVYVYVIGLFMCNHVILCV